MATRIVRVCDRCDDEAGASAYIVKLLVNGEDPVDVCDRCIRDEIDKIVDDARENRDDVGVTIELTVSVDALATTQKTKRAVDLSEDF